MKSFLKNLRESSLSIVPVTAVVFVLFAFGWIDMSGPVIVRTVISMILLIFGVMLFNVGTSNGIQPIGELMSASLTKRGKVLLLSLVVFALGFLLTAAEPSVSVFGGQTPIDMTIFIIVSALGVGVFLTLGALRIIFQWKIKTVLTFFYMILFGIIVLLKDKAFIPIAFDGSAATTGLLTFPLFLSLASGIANNRGGNNPQEDSFGLIGVSAIGPMISIVLTGVLMAGGGELIFEVVKYADYSGMAISEIARVMGKDFGKQFLYFFVIALIIIIPIGAMFAVYDITNIKLPKKKRQSIYIGLAATILGMMFFLTGANVGYVPLGNLAGTDVANSLPLWALLIVGFILGFVNASAEPGVHILSQQVEEVSNGAITFKTMLITLSTGLGISVFLSVGRIYWRIPVEYMLMIGFFISLTLAQIVPSIYTGIAFDSGGAVSGPMTTSFITPFISAIAVVQFENAVNPLTEVVPYAFGSVGLVALIPTITIQLLGLHTMIIEKRHLRYVRSQVFSEDDAEIIYFPEVD